MFLPALRLVAAFSIFVFALPATLPAQNAAQQKALAKLHPNASTTNGVEATTVPLADPAGLAYDSAGNLYIAALNDHVIRKVDLQGIITTVAGTGEQGFGGDGSAATSALLDSPAGVALDTANNLYIADTRNNRIRMVAAPTGLITTIAGNGAVGFSGDGSAATTATLNHPQAVAVDPTGNVYIADTGNNRIRKLTGAIISTIAGNGDQAYESDNVLATATGLDSPAGLTLDTARNLYLADTRNQRVRLVTAATGIITTVAGNGTRAFSGDGASATAATLDRPRGLATDATGKLYIADSDNNRIRTVSAGTIVTLAGTGEQGFSGDTATATAAILDTPRAATVYSSGTTASVAITDSNNSRARAVSASSGMVATVAGLGTATTETLILSGATTGIYGTGSLTTTFANNGNLATGQVQLLEGTTTLGTATLTTDTATLPLPLLSVGTHSLSVAYAGDAANPAIASGLYLVTVTPAPVTATAAGVVVPFGQPIPALTGTLTGVLTPDLANATAVFSTTATSTSAPGVYPIAVRLTGSASANYAVTLSPASGSVTVGLATTTTLLTTSNATPYLGVPITLTAAVSSTSGTPTGTVTFRNAGMIIGAGTLSNGVATLALSNLSLGVQAITATYAGTASYGASSSPALAETVAPDPDFSLAVTGASLQTIVPGSSVIFAFLVTPQPAPFDNGIALTVTGLPSGATASFTPASVTPAGTPSAFSMSVKTAPIAALLHNGGKLGGSLALALLILPWISGRRRHLTRPTATLLLCVGAGGAATLLSGCGTGNGFFGQAPQAYTLTVTGTSTNAAGATLIHSTTVTLTLQ